MTYDITTLPAYEDEWRAPSASGVGDGNDVTTWANLHSGAPSFVAPAGHKPKYRANVGGIPCVDFSPTDAVMVAAGVANGPVTSTTYLVVKPGSMSTGPQLFLSGNRDYPPALNLGAGGFGDAGKVGVGQVGGGAGTQTSLAVLDTSWQLITLLLNCDDPDHCTVTVKRNGVIKLGPTDLGALPAGAVDLYLGGELRGDGTTNDNLRGPVWGVFRFGALHSDSDQAKAHSSIVDTIGAAAALTTADYVTTNASPTVSAGSDATVALAYPVVTLAGTDADTDGTIASRAWTFESAPAGSTLTNTAITGRTTANASFTPDVAGTYVVRYTVTDNGGAAAFDLKSVTATPPAGGVLDQRELIFDGVSFV